MFKRFSAVAVTIAAITAFAVTPAFASTASVPHAGTVNAIYSQNLAGYTVTLGSTQFNEVRATVTLPDYTNDGVQPDSVGSGVLLASTVNGGEEAILAPVWDATGNQSAGCSANSWTLEWDAQHTSSETNLLPVTDLTPVQSSDSAVCLNGGSSEYLELHQSTNTGVLSVVAGPDEFDNNATLAQKFIGKFSRFYVAGVGMNLGQQGEPDTTGFGTLPLGTQSMFTRVGVTEPAGFNRGGIAGTRVTFDFFPQTKYVATSTGTAPTTDSVGVAAPTALPATSSDFSVVVGIG
jgi:hypothetical protein